MLSLLIVLLYFLSFGSQGTPVLTPPIVPYRGFAGARDLEKEFWTKLNRTTNVKERDQVLLSSEEAIGWEFNLGNLKNDGDDRLSKFLGMVRKPKKKHDREILKAKKRNLCFYGSKEDVISKKCPKHCNFCLEIPWGQTRNIVDRSGVSSRICRYNQMCILDLLAKMRKQRITRIHSKRRKQPKEIKTEELKRINLDIFRN